MSHKTPHPCPIVLVGGFLVWGREERFGFKYWGGRVDLEAQLNREGYPFLTASPGPFSSNWDRACELYAMLKGGRVDYGQAHSQRHGHERFGETFEGLYPEWGERAKVHFIGHSMGGQTIRMLAHLLAKGDNEERNCTPAKELSPLFAGHHRWAASLCSIATPHHGTTLAWNREGLIEAANKGFALAAHFGLRGWRRVLDLKLSHWGLERREDESRLAFFKRVTEHPLWRGTQDLAAFELSPEGASKLNAKIRTPPWLPCFSWSLAKTAPGPDGKHLPQAGMLPLWRRNARYMGQTTHAPGRPSVNPSWFQNDGVVNTCSMWGVDTVEGELPAHVVRDVPPHTLAPSAGRARSGADTVEGELPAEDSPAGMGVHSLEGPAPWNLVLREINPAKLAPGVWHPLGLLVGWDHTEILGIGQRHQDEWMDFYRKWADFVAKLERKS